MSKISRLVITFLLSQMLSSSPVSGASVQQKDTGSINVLVTGASSGIGKSIVMEFAKSSKYRVWATMRSLDSWTEPHMDNVEVAMMDVTSDSSVTNTITDMINKEGRIDIVVNNAGYGIVGCLEAVSIDAAKDLFEVNVWGVVRVLQAVLPHMRKEKSGHIIAVSSIAGIRGIPAYEFYTGSKFALEGIMDSMRYTLYPYNIHVTNVSPGPVKTGFLNRVSEPTSIETRKVANDNEDYISGYRDLALSDFNKRLDSDDSQTPQEVARVVVNIAIIGRSKVNPDKFTEVPFNIGTGKSSQSIIEAVRKHPTGWGGIYSEILQTVRQLNHSSISLPGGKVSRAEL